MADNGTPPIVGKAGIQTTEFAVVALTIIGNFATHIWGHDWGIAENAQNIVLLGTSIVAGIYALARSWVKVGTHKAIALESAAGASAVKNRFQLLNVAGVTHLFDTVTGDLKTLWGQEKQAAERAAFEQRAIGEEAKQDAAAVVQDIKVPSYN